MIRAAMKFQDAHSHFFSRSFFLALAKQSPKEGTPAELVAELAERSGIELPGEDVIAHTDRWIAEMDRIGIERMVTFASAPPEAASVSQAVAHAGGRLIGYTVVDPTQPNALEFATQALTDLGLRGLLVFPAMSHVEACDPRMDDLLALAGEQRAPVIVHCGILKIALRDLLGLPRPYDLQFANPLSLVPAANRHPGTTFVLPHFGGGFLREALMAGMQCENIFVDTSSSNDWMRSDPSGLRLTQVFRRAIDALGAERILFGTDSSTFPRGYRVDVRDTQLGSAREAGATDEQLAAIFGGNLAALLPER